MSFPLFVPHRVVLSAAGFIKPGSPQALCLRLESGDAAVVADSYPGGLLVAAASDPFDLINVAIPYAASLSGTAQPRWAKTRPDFMVRGIWTLAAILYLLRLCVFSFFLQLEKMSHVCRHVSAGLARVVHVGCVLFGRERTGRARGSQHAAPKR